jgi:hypothetical protein
MAIKMVWRLECSSVVECLFNMCEVLGLIPSTTKKEKRKKKKVPLDQELWFLYHTHHQNP